MRQNYADQDASAKFASKFDAAGNADAVINIAADPDEFWVLDAIGFSYSGAPSTGRLTVSIGGTTLIDMDIRGSGHDYLRFSEPFYNSNETRNEAMVITLHAGGAGVTGKVFARYR